MSELALIGVGGSIATPGRDRLDLADYGEEGQVETLSHLLKLNPEVAAQTVLRPIDFRLATSNTLTPDDWLGIRALINGLATEPAIDGIVVVHGTSSLEETAYFLHLTVRTELPIVLVGAQRPPNALSSDAGLNLLNAVRVGSSQAVRGLGVLVVAANEIYSARALTKSSTYGPLPFKSPDAGFLGYVDVDGTLSVYSSPIRRHAPDTPFAQAELNALPRVDIAYSYAGADGAAIRAFVEAGARGIVSAGFLPGVVTPAEADALREARDAGVVVLQSRRGQRGRVAQRRRLIHDQFVSTDNLNPVQSRVLAMLALTQTSNYEKIQALFGEY